MRGELRLRDKEEARYVDRSSVKFLLQINLSDTFVSRYKWPVSRLLHSRCITKRSLASVNSSSFISLLAHSENGQILVYLPCTLTRLVYIWALDDRIRFEDLSRSLRFDLQTNRTPVNLSWWIRGLRPCIGPFPMTVVDALLALDAQIGILSTVLLSCHELAKFR